MGEKVRIGIEAPRAVPVFRKEVYLEIQEGRGATEGEGEDDVEGELDRLKA
jgi:carbon storage regulator